jgi:hypothetical protein
MKRNSELPIVSIAAALLLVASVALSAAQELKRKLKVYPKPTQPETQQQVLPPLLKSIIPGADVQYQRAAQNPNVRPNYQEPENYSNPIVRHIELPTPETMREAQRWLNDPSAAPDRNRTRPNLNVLPGRSTQFLTKPTLVPTTSADAQTVVSTYKSIPTGMVVEGQAIGVGAVDDLQYDAILNAFVINNRAVYFSPIAPQSLAALCRSIVQDDRIGVALGVVEITYGELPHDSRVAVDLKLADNFLGNITFGQAEWLAPNYPLAGGYIAKSDPSPAATAVMFKFRDFRFEAARGVVRATGTNFEVRLIPISDQRADDGGALPDYQAIARGAISPNFEDNARHVTHNIDYYRRETFVENAFHHGEVAAFIRTLKAEHVDLIELAELIEQSTGIGQLVTVAPVSEMGQPINQLFAAWRTHNLPLYLDQWSPNAVQTNKTKVSRFADIKNSRAQLFPQLGNVGAVNILIYLGYQNDAGIFRNQYILEYDLAGTVRRGSACETYKVRNEGGRWVIIENQEDDSC